MIQIPALRMAERCTGLLSNVHCVYVCMCACTHVCLHTCMHAGVCVYVCVCVCVHVPRTPTSGLILPHSIDLLSPNIALHKRGMGVGVGV